MILLDLWSRCGIKVMHSCIWERKHVFFFCSPGGRKSYVPAVFNTVSSFSPGCPRNSSPSSADQIQCSCAHWCRWTHVYQQLGNTDKVPRFQVRLLHFLPTSFHCVGIDLILEEQLGNHNSVFEIMERGTAKHPGDFQNSSLIFPPSLLFKLCCVESTCWGHFSQINTSVKAKEVFLI